ncbi:MAG: transposase, partial [Pseudohongiella sp.]|nr:transposase [Pseudohongiella sp.]
MQRIEVHTCQWHTYAMTQPDLNKLDAEQLRALVAQLIGNASTQEMQLQTLQQRNQSIEQRNQHLEAVNAKLSHELLLLRRLKFGAQSEKISPLQRSLLDDIIDADA